jgi:hypothetical protein
MRKADLAKNHDEFEKDMDWYIDFLNRMLGAKRVVNYYDKLEILESLVIRLCAIWEAFIEGEMIDCLNIDCCSRYGEELQLKIPENPNKDLCEAILVGSGYLDFKSVADIKSKAKKALPDEVNPFNLIRTNPTAKRIDELYIMRNYLSHYSGKSRRALMKMYQQNPWRLKNFREPGDFLFAYRGKRLIQYIEALLDASEQMRGIIS